MEAGVTLAAGRSKGPLRRSAPLPRPRRRVGPRPHASPKGG